MRWVLPALMMVVAPLAANAEAVVPAVSIASASDGTTWSVSMQILALMTVLTLLPSLALAATSFTRIVIVLAILRQALGMPQTPPNQVLIGLALFLSLFVMAPILDEVNVQSISPYMAGDIGFEQAAERAQSPMREFMLEQVREPDLALFTDLAGRDGYESEADIPMSVLIPSFMTSELKTAFQIGFLTFLPFLIIDLVVSSVLMSMGMMMLSPMLISLPFKIMLFVLVDGWSLIMGTLAASFGT